MVRARCYTHFALDPHHNMAVDETLFAHALETPGFVALRLYTWRPGGITFGTNQRVEKAVDHDALDGTALIRRVTGGRALYHDESELTYAVVVNTADLGDCRLGGSVAQSSAQIAQAITRFLARQGTASQYLRHTVQADRRPSFFHTAPCFASAARHEIVAGTRKIVASAQRRVGSALLQHGSIKIAGVAYHAALDGPECPGNRERDLHPVTAHELQSHAALFFEELGRFLGLACERAELSRREEEAVKKRRLIVEKIPVERRDIIKQGALDGSL